MSKPIKVLQDLTEIINIEAIRQLPKATEHFMSDLHGEYEAFEHILRNGSGSIREKVQILFQNKLTEAEQTELCFCIYYPEELILASQRSETEWLDLMEMLVSVTRFAASKYTRSKVRKAIPAEYAYILEELLYQYDAEFNKKQYYAKIFQKILQLQLAEDFCLTLAQLIQRFVVDHLHILGDIYDRGPAPDKIMDRLMQVPSLDIQLGNHDLLWIGSYCGSLPCLLNTLRIAARYGHLSLLTKGYGINLEKAITFSRQYYQENAAFLPQHDTLSEADAQTAMLLQQAFTIMQFKVEAAVIKRRPEFGLTDRLMLDKISADRQSIELLSGDYQLQNGCFQLVDSQKPAQLTIEEADIIHDLLVQFQHAEKLKKHVTFLVEKGTLYQTYNGNLLYHGCIPSTENGDFQGVTFEGKTYRGKALMDFYQTCIKNSFQTPDTQDDLATDILWYLWCGEGSSLFGKKAMKTFERYFLVDSDTHQEEKNAYYHLREEADFCRKILAEFGLPEEGCIINGHTPVKVRKGETPIKAGGKLLVIDGGLSKPYQKKTGIAGYTLLYNSYGLNLAAHQPFTNRKTAINKRQDIITQRKIVMRNPQRVYVRDTDIGRRLAEESRELHKGI